MQPLRMDPHRWHAQAQLRTDREHNAHNVADGSNVELQARRKAAPDSPAYKADLLPEPPLVLLAQINNLLCRHAFSEIISFTLKYLLCGEQASFCQLPFSNSCRGKAT